MKGVKLLLMLIVFVFTLALILPVVYSADRALSAPSKALQAPVYDATAARDAAIVYPKYPDLTYFHLPCLSLNEGSETVEIYATYKLPEGGTARIQIPYPRVCDTK